MNMPWMLLAPAGLALAAEVLAGQGQSLPSSYGTGYPGFHTGPRSRDLYGDGPGRFGVSVSHGGQHSKANEAHHKLCEALGGHDVTNTVKITLGPTTLDAGVCVGVVSALQPNPTALPIPGGSDEPLQYPAAWPQLISATPGETPAPDSYSGPPPSIIPHPTIGSARAGRNYVAVAGAEFIGVPGPVEYLMTANVGHLGAECSWQIDGILPSAEGIRVFGFGLCRASVDTDDVDAELLVCVGAASCEHGHGVVRHYI